MSSPFNLPKIPRMVKPTYEELERELVDLRLQRSSYRNRVENLESRNKLLSDEIVAQKALVNASKVSSYDLLDSLESMATCDGRISKWSGSLIKIILSLKTIPARKKACQSWQKELGNMRVPDNLPRQFKALLDVPALFYPECETDEEKKSRELASWKHLLESVSYHTDNVLKAEQKLLAEELRIVQEAEDMIGFDRAHKLKLKCEVFATKRSHDANAPDKFDYV